jgi:hypothetical protein
LKEARKAKLFYIEALGGSLLRDDEHFEVIDWQGFPAGPSRDCLVASRLPGCNVFGAKTQA